MDVEIIAAKIDEIAKELRAIDWDDSFETNDTAIWDLDDYIVDLEQLVDDIRAEEAEKRLIILGGNTIALCLWCGLRLYPNEAHPCPNLTYRGQIDEGHIGYRNIQEEVSRGSET